MNRDASAIESTSVGSSASNHEQSAASRRWPRDLEQTAIKPELHPKILEDNVAPLLEPDLPRGLRRLLA
jgi:hypothetical protein